MRQRKNRKIEGKITDTVQNIFVYDCCLMNQKKLSLPLYHEVFDTVKLARKGKKNASAFNGTRLQVSLSTVPFIGKSTPSAQGGERIC